MTYSREKTVSLFTELQLTVQTIMEAGRPLDDAEEVINDEGHDLSEDERAALWLWAWSLLSQNRQRHEALRYLELLDSGDYN